MSVTRKYLKVGDRLKANWTEEIMDHVTGGKVYEVIEVGEIGFWIINDKGEKCFPISATFEKITHDEQRLRQLETAIQEVKRLTDIERPGHVKVLKIKQVLEGLEK